MFAACLLVLCSAGAISLAAQANPSLMGQWQGSLEGSTPERVLLRFEPADAASPRGVVYLLDEDNAAWPHATSQLSLQGTGLSFRIANLDIAFTGRLADGTTLAGIWKRHGTELPLKLLHVSGDAAWPVPVDDSRSMAANADPGFDVATVKPADPKDTGSGFQQRGQRLHVRNETLEAIVSFAYGIHRGQIQAAPGWFATDRWEIDGLPDTPGSPSLQQMRTMYRKLLADRFALKLDRQTRELPVYLLETTGQPKLTRSLGDPNGPPDSTGNYSGINDVRYTDMTMDEFARDLAFSQDRPVVDATKLAGRYDFRLRWMSPDAPAASLPDGADAPPALFTALREQLGLSLKATRSPADVYVILHVEHPSAN